MVNLRIWKIVLVAFLTSLLCVGCSDDSQSDDASAYSVTVIFAPEGLGDRGYSDNIYRGVRQFEKENSIHTDFYNPSNYAELETLIQNWVDEGKDTVLSKYISKRLLITTDGAVSEIFKKHPEWKNSDYSSFLMLDSKNTESLDVYSRYVSLYGVSHLAGQLVYELGYHKSAVIAANPSSEAVSEAVDGFAYGYNLAGGTLDSSDIYYLDDGVGGYDMADSAYRLTYNLDSLGYDFIFPVAGGSEEGVLRYSRENDDKPFYVCGMDVDRQAYSKKVVFSIVKRMDLVTKDFLALWMAGSAIKRDVSYGLESKFIEVIEADDYSSQDFDYSEQMETAIKAEKEYMKW